MYKPIDATTCNDLHSSFGVTDSYVIANATKNLSASEMKKKNWNRYTKRNK